MALPQEFVLAAACAMWPPSERRSKAIRNAASATLDWNYFARLVDHHRVVGLVNDGLKRADVRNPANARQIGADATRMARQNLAMAAESARLQQLFAIAELPVTFLKGTPLAVLAYQNLALRHSKDIDLLVSPQSLFTAAEILENAGYRRWEPPPEIGEPQLRAWMREFRHFNYTHAHSGIEIELHWKLFKNPHLMPGLEAVHSRALVSVSDGIELPTLADDDQFAYLCAHGASHCWFRLKWLADIAALLAQEPPEDVERLLRAAAARNAGVPAAQAILLCNQLLGAAVPASLIASLRTSRRVRWLEATAIMAMIAGESKIEPAGTHLRVRRETLAQIFMVPGWRYSFAELRTLLITPEDIKEFHFPERISLLYLLFRLCRSIWQRIGRFRTS